MTDVDLGLTQRMHKPGPLPVSDTGDRWCVHCKLMWPCDAIQLAEEVERLREMLDPRSALRHELLKEVCAENEKMRQEVDRLRAALEKVVADLENEPYTFTLKYSERALRTARAALDGKENEDG